LGVIKAVLFDLNGTLAFLDDGITAEHVSDYLFSRGYEVSSQQYGAAWSFVSFIDYPKHGYGGWRSYLLRVFQRLHVRVDGETLNELIRLYRSRPFQLCPDAAEAVLKAKENGFKTAIVTSIAYFRFRDAIRPIRKRLNLVMTGREAGCDKSNPNMYRKVLELLKVKPQEAIMIGDELLLDVQLPKQLGIDAILLDREDKKDGQLVDAFVYSLDQAMETIIRRNLESS